MSVHWPMVPLGELATPIERATRPLPGIVYRQIGVRLWGEGAYEREPMDGAATKYALLYRAEADDIIVNKIWARNGSIAVVQSELAGCFGSGEFPMFAPNRECLEPRWFHWITKTRWFWQACDERARGTSGKNRIRPEKFLEIGIPLPPLSEQRRIVAKIEQLAAKIDEACGLRRLSETEVECLDASLLTAAIPGGVPVRSLDSVIDPESNISYGVLVPGPHVDDGIPFVRVQDLDPKDPPREPAKRIGPEVEVAYARTQLLGGEVLVAVVGATIGKVGIAPPEWRGANIARAVCRIVPGAEIDRDYLVAVLRSGTTQRYFVETTRTLAQPTLNVKQLRQTAIPLPPIDEQRRIVAYLDDLQAKVDRLKALQAQTATELDVLLPSILDRAFKGEL